mmetsp:Transcript_58072/g.180428  ORF Transcript_58072/g.180428 Transcript_58072/m.180428 type:complete len:208 (-) Transcript_58072:274-897(-)
MRARTAPDGQASRKPRLQELQAVGPGQIHDLIDYRDLLTSGDGAAGHLLLDLHAVEVKLAGTTAEGARGSDVWQPEAEFVGLFVAEDLRSDNRREADEPGCVVQVHGRPFVERLGQTEREPDTNLLIGVQCAIVGAERISGVAAAVQLEANVAALLDEGAAADEADAVRCVHRQLLLRAAGARQPQGHTSSIQVRIEELGSRLENSS